MTIKKHINRFKKAAALTLAAVLTAGTLVPTSAFAKFEGNDIKIESKNAIVINAESGAVLYEKNADEKLYPASTTKILTGLIALENLKMTDKVKVSQNALLGQENNGTHMGLKRDELVTVDDLMHGMMMVSANDAATALAEHIAGSEEEFAKLMNKKLKDLGIENTNFVNSHGLYDKDHYTTARDMAKIMAHCVKNEDFVKITGAIKHRQKKTNKRDESYVFYTTNKMTIGKSMYYQYLVCGKAGYTDESKAQYIAYAEKNGQKLICYVGGNSSPFDICADAQKAMEKCFKYYTTTETYQDKHGKDIESIIKSGDYVIRNSKTAVDEFKVSVPGITSPDQVEFRLKDFGLSCPIEEGRMTGMVQAWYDGDIVGETALYANKDLSRFMQVFSTVYKGIILMIVAGVLVILGLRTYNKKQKEKRKKVHGARTYDRPAKNITPTGNGGQIHHTYHNTKKK